MDIDPETTLVIGNPAAAGGWVGRNWDDLVALVRRYLGDVEMQQTEGPNHGTELARRALWAGKRTLFSLGGDGTHSEVVAGIVKGHPAPGAITVGVLSAGTGGDFARLLKEKGSIEDYLRGLKTANAPEIDVGQLKYQSPVGDTLTRLFLNECSFGLSEPVCQRVNASSKWMGARLTYFVATVGAAREHSPSTIRIKVDGQEVGIFEATTVMISNGRFAGGGMLFAPDARLSDAMLDVTVVRDLAISDIFLRAPSLYRGRLHATGFAESFRGFKVEAEHITGPLPRVESDGEPVGTLPIETTVIPGALRLIGVREDVL